MSERIVGNQLNGSALAYIGDSVYETYVREYVLSKGLTSPNHLHKAGVKYVSAQGQAKIMVHWLADDETLTQEEISIYKRGRNHKANTKAKNASIQDYRQATGFEALMGWLYLEGNENRLEELIQIGLGYIDEEGKHE